MSNDALCVNAFFTSFHRNFPVLHEASFHVISAPAPLLNTITCIGSLYCSSTFTEQSRNALFESTLSSIQSYVSTLVPVYIILSHFRSLTGFESFLTYDWSIRHPAFTGRAKSITISRILGLANISLVGVHGSIRRRRCELSQSATNSSRSRGCDTHVADVTWWHFLAPGLKRRDRRAWRERRRIWRYGVAGNQMARIREEGIEEKARIFKCCVTIARSNRLLDAFILSISSTHNYPYYATFDQCSLRWK